jgi:hypothetical protein
MTDQTATLLRGLLLAVGAIGFLITFARWRIGLVVMLYSTFATVTFWEFTQDGHLGHLFFAPTAALMQYAMHLQNQELETAS